MYNTITTSGSLGTEASLVSKVTKYSYSNPSIAKLKDGSYLICYSKKY